MANRNSVVEDRAYFMLDCDEWHGYSSESLWICRVHKERNAIVLNAPFFVRGVSVGDTILLELKEDRLWYSGTSGKSGNATLRLLVPEFSSKQIEANKLLNSLRRVGCSYEGADIGSTKLLSIDIPANVSAHDVVEIVDIGLELDLWDAEMGDTSGRTGFWGY